MFFELPKRFVIGSLPKIKSNPTNPTIQFQQHHFHSADMCNCIMKKYYVINFSDFKSCQHVQRLWRLRWNLQVQYTPALQIVDGIFSSKSPFQLFSNEVSHSHTVKNYFHSLCIITAILTKLFLVNYSNKKYFSIIIHPFYLNHTVTTNSLKI